MVAKKRKATEAAPEERPARRLSGRVKKAEIKYEESFSNAEDDGSDGEFNEEVEESVDEEDPEAEEEDAYDSDASDDGAKKTKKWTKKGAEDSDEMEVEIPQEKHDGGIPYEDERLHKNTLDFLKDLKKNNRREWLKWHDKPFRQAENDFKSFVGELNSIVCEKDPTVPELPIKDIIYRIYRDIRFSPDPTPYKSYFSVAWSRTGRKGPYAHYYLHVQPGSSFLGGGYWTPDSATLGCLREDIDNQSHQLKSILTGDRLRNCFFPDAKKDEKKVVAAFCAMNAENALKTKPKGYAADHDDISLLKLRNYALRKSISDSDLTGENALEILGGIVESIEPFITYLNNTVMP